MFDSFQNLDYTNFESVQAAFHGLEASTAIIAVIACVIFALFACRLFKFGITVGAATAFGTIGAMYAPLLLDKVSLPLPEGFNIIPIIAFILAIVGAVLAWWLYKVSIFLAGAGAGYFAGALVATYLGSAGAGIAFFDGKFGTILVSVVCAIACAFLFLFLYKFLYIFASSMCGMVAAGLILGEAIYPALILYFLIAGVVAGVFAMIYQYKTAKM